MIEIRKATKNLAAEIARLIMMAMTDECCLYYCADGCGLGAFRKMMTCLVNREHLFVNSLLGYFHFLAIHKQSVAVGFDMRSVAFE